EERVYPPDPMTTTLEALLKRECGEVIPCWSYGDMRKVVDDALQLLVTVAETESAATAASREAPEKAMLQRVVKTTSDIWRIGMRMKQQPPIIPPRVSGGRPAWDESKHPRGPDGRW